MPGNNNKGFTHIWNTLMSVDVTGYTIIKNRMKYLPWAHAQSLMLNYFPDTVWEFTEYGENRLPALYYPDGSAEVACTITVTHEGASYSRSMWLPVMDNRHNSRKNPSSKDVSNAKMRCFVKCLAANFGLGLSLYYKDESIFDSLAPEEDEPQNHQASVEPAEPAELRRNGWSPIGYTECVEKIKAMGEGYLRSVQRYRNAVGLPGLADVTDATRGAFLSQLVPKGKLVQVIQDLHEGTVTEDDALISIQRSVGHAYELAGGALRKNYPGHVIGLLETVGDMTKSIHAAEMCVLYDLLFSEVAPDLAAQPPQMH
jgi:hypothetical protein